MAEYEERSLEDLTEEPSQHRLEELRQKGSVVQSRDLTATVTLLGIIIALYFLSGKFLGEVTTLMKDIFGKDLARPAEVQDWRAFTEVAGRCLRVLMAGFLPVGLAGLFLGLLTAVAQVGFVFTSEPLTPDFDRVNPVSGLLRVFSLKTLVEGMKSILKFAVVTLAVYLVIKSQIGVLPSVVGYGIEQLLTYIGSTTIRVFGTVGILLLGVGGFDYWVQWRRHRKQAMMTKSEAKQELKEREGDPQIKARIRSIQRDMARKRMMKAVPKADVVITNPTHIAVALVYTPGESFAPKVIAKGADYLAERIKKIARENGVPTVENKPLARTLYKHVKVGQMIPRSLYQAVAEILAYVYKLKGKKLGAPAPTPPSPAGE